MGSWALLKNVPSQDIDHQAEFDLWRNHMGSRVGIMAAIMTYPLNTAEYQCPSELVDAPAAWAWVAAMVNRACALQVESEAGDHEEFSVAYDYDMVMYMLNVFFSVGGYYMYCRFRGQFVKLVLRVERLLQRKVQQYHGNAHSAVLKDELERVYLPHLKRTNGLHKWTSTVPPQGDNPGTATIACARVATWIADQRSGQWAFPHHLKVFNLEVAHPET